MESTTDFGALESHASKAKWSTSSERDVADEMEETARPGRECRLPRNDAFLEGLSSFLEGPSSPKPTFFVSDVSVLVSVRYASSESNESEPREAIAFSSDLCESSTALSRPSLFDRDCFITVSAETAGFIACLTTCGCLESNVRTDVRKEYGAYVLNVTILIGLG